MKELFTRCLSMLKSQRGRDVWMFLLFVGVSTILWCVLTLNRYDQHDIRMPIEITNVPDSVTVISKGPDALNVSLRARGTQMLKMLAGGAPTVTADFRAFRSGGTIFLSPADLKGLVRSAAGGAQVNVVYPDTIKLRYTTHAGYLLPVKVNYRATAAPQAALVGKPKLSSDSVKIYLPNGEILPDNYNSVATEPLRMLAIDKTSTRRVKLIPPKGGRVIPDSIDITFVVEPMIFKSRKVVIEPANVPDGIKLITFPAQIDAFFMIPMSAYAKGLSNFRVVADFKTIRPGSNMVKLKLEDVPNCLHNIQLKVDSAEYIIERKR